MRWKRQLIQVCHLDQVTTSETAKWKKILLICEVSVTNNTVTNKCLIIVLHLGAHRLLTFGEKYLTYATIYKIQIIKSENQ